MLRKYFNFIPTRQEYLGLDKFEKIKVLVGIIGIISAIYSAVNFFYSHISVLLLSPKYNEFVFEGPWNEQIASKQLLDILRNREKSNSLGFTKEHVQRTSETYVHDKEYDDCEYISDYICKKGSPYAHGIYGFFHVKMGGVDSVIGLAYSNLILNTCHSCFPYFTVVEYIQDGVYWKIKNIDFAAFESGSYGSPICKLDVVEIGHGIFAIRNHSTYTQNGVMDDIVTFITKVKGKYSEVLTLDIQTEHMVPTYVCKNDIRIIPAGLSYYEIRISSKGSKKCPSMKEKGYIFNGITYVDKDNYGW